MSDTQIVGRARPNDPTTSWAAASEQTKGSQSRVANALAALLRNYGPMTDEQLWSEWEWHRALATSKYPQVTAQRLRTVRAELVRAGDVVDSGDRGLTGTGRAAVMWAVA